MSGMILVLMGVCGSGKTTIGVKLSTKLGWPLEDADSYHSEASKRKMSRGVALTDEDRLPWLYSLRSIINRWQSVGSSGILTCSALKKSYRDILRGRDDRNRTDLKIPASKSAIRRTNDCSASSVGSRTDCRPSVQGRATSRSQDPAGSQTREQSRVVFVYLKGSRRTLEERLKVRTSHFMCPLLLDSQLQCLEEPSPDECHLVVDIDQTPDLIVNEIMDIIAINTES